MTPAILLASALIVSAIQSPNKAFEGTWTAEHAGQTFVRLELQGAGAATAGRLSLGDIELDKTGQVKTAHASKRPATPIFDVSERAGTLRFARKDGRGTDRFELKLIDPTSADLTFVLTDEMRKEMASLGIAEFKPVRLKKLARN